jgi:hypothetical protein
MPAITGPLNRWVSSSVEPGRKNCLLGVSWPATTLESREGGWSVGRGRLDRGPTTLVGVTLVAVQHRGDCPAGEDDCEESRERRGSDPQ